MLNNNGPNINVWLNFVTCEQTLRQKEPFSFNDFPTTVHRVVSDLTCYCPYKEQNQQLETVNLHDNYCNDKVSISLERSEILHINNGNEQQIHKNAH